ncbi:acyltransferase family protein [Aquimarina brevivitae]|uniref:Putative membrane protein n=1 Tax=Aquimarina brevivitae TaxID=323412 RepID=A0A4Q7NYX2_9FLAO|nr:acyltransferase family protein [Aquimarina brevivitae]RZS92250.1 putative membrane protein [Aquimarina brevivitae]
MSNSSNRLHYIDAIRAFAILMMLQGHFVYALLSDEFRDRTSTIYTVWEYFRGITAPTFFTITGFVFIFLLLKNKVQGLKNPRVAKGIKRALKLICWGYLLRLSLYALFSGKINASFLMVDVLQCIGLSLLLLIGTYVLMHRFNLRILQYTFLTIGFVIFLVHPWYDKVALPNFPEAIANYLTSIYGSVFTIFPWFGYVCFGGFLAIIFKRFGEQPKFYPFITSLLFAAGFALILFSSPLLVWLHEFTGVELFQAVAYNNFLYMRLGDVFVLFGIFITLKKLFTNPLITKIGSRTLSIYIIHFFILYGTWTGLGLSKFLSRSLSGYQVIGGALLFIFTVCFIVLTYYKNEDRLLRIKNVSTQYLLDLLVNAKDQILNSSSIKVVQSSYRAIKQRF